MFSARGGYIGIDFRPFSMDPNGGDIPVDRDQKCQKSGSTTSTPLGAGESCSAERSVPIDLQLSNFWRRKEL